MMTLAQSFLLGAVQGLTEFLPVSSSGHLVLVQLLMGLNESMLAFDIAVHWATLIAVFVYFWKDFYEMRTNVRLMTMIVLASVPTALMGIFFKNYFESLFGSLQATGIGFIVTAAFLMASVKFHNGSRSLPEMKPMHAVWIGIAQGISIIPSISRSGATILAAMLCGIERRDAVRFSFWVGVPAILGAGLLKLKEGVGLALDTPGIFWAGFLTSGILGFLTISVLLKITARGKFHYFGYYCLGIGIFTLWLSIRT